MSDDNSITEIETRLAEALITFARLPDRTKPAGYRVAWPEFLRTWEDFDVGVKVRFSPPEPSKIDEAMEALDWLSMIDPGDDTRRLVASRCLGKSLRDLEKRYWKLGRIARPRKLKKDSLKQYYTKGLHQIQKKRAAQGKKAAP